MRVCIATPHDLGGTETFILAHLERLPQPLVHIHGLQNACAWEGRLLSEWFGQTRHGMGKWLNLLPRYLEFRMRGRYFPQLTATDILREFLLDQAFDVVLAEYGTAGAFVTPACFAAGVPLVVHFHGFDASRRDTIAQHADAYREMFEYASAVISVSQAMSGQLAELGCPVGKIILNPYGPDPRYANISPDYSSNMLLAVGRQTHKKAPYLTLDAFRIALAKCPELRLCMIGDGELLEVSERLTSAWKLEDKVDLLGFADQNLIAQKMQLSFAFLQHSICARNGDSEGMPVAILEAAAAGLPIISTRHAGIPEAVIDEVTGFIVEPGNTQCMAERIVLLASDRQLAERLGTDGRVHVAANFSMDQHISCLTRILEGAKQLAFGNNEIASGS